MQNINVDEIIANLIAHSGPNKFKYKISCTVDKDVFDNRDFNERMSLPHWCRNNILDYTWDSDITYPKKSSCITQTFSFKNKEDAVLFRLSAA